jgi:hypothetical protein
MQVREQCTALEPNRKGLAALLALFAFQWHWAGRLQSRFETDLARGLLILMVVGSVFNPFLRDHTEALLGALPQLEGEGIRERGRQREERDRLLQLCLARAEEGVILTHVDNAATFANLLEPHMPLGRAVEEYNRYLSLKGGRAQAVFQRTMARLAEDRLPPRPQRSLPRLTDEGGRRGQAP